jgi:hypothetical protein
MQRVAAGGGVVAVLVGVGVGVGVAVEVGVALGVGVEFLTPGETGGVRGECFPGVTLPVEPGFGVPAPELGVTLPPPGLGSGTGGGGVTGPGVPVGIGGVGCAVVVAAVPAEAC